jgi:archaellin
MGIETLIIFIAMIIVAAIASGVLLRTQGVLQQRALAVGNEARERIITGIEVVSIVGYVNTSRQQITQFEMILRPRSGSGDIQLNTLGLTLTAQNYFLQAVLQTERQNVYNSWEPTFFNGTQVLTGYNLNYDSYDIDIDRANLVGPDQSPDGLSGINFTLSDGKQFIFPIGVNFSNTSQEVEIIKEPIYYNYSDIYSEAFGFLTLVGTSSGDLEIDTVNGNFTTFKIETDRDGSCAWQYLVSNYRFCYVVRLGNTNSVLEFGEMITLRYKLSSDYFLNEEDIFNIQFIPKGGAIEDIQMFAPQVLSRQVVTLWP